MTSYQRLQKVLTEIFQLDQADLDFGIYRIMNQKREEINKFLNDDLLPQVKKVIDGASDVDSESLRKELADAEAGARALEMDPGIVPAVKRLRTQLEEVPDTKKLEEEVFSLLANFFRRYYDKGDFISQRRYKKNVYAIPYEGEEVKLHWANHDQYYIKSSEYLKNYAFKVPAGRVRFELTNASTEQNNNKAAAGKNRYFQLNEEQPFTEEGNDLIVYFTYQPIAGKVKQKDLNAIAVSTLAPLLPKKWLPDVLAPKPTDKQKDRTLLLKHLNDFTARNTFDYFIHKDLSGFLNRELDFFIKNEVVHLDDIDHADPEGFRVLLTRVQALKTIARKIIRFLAQLEEFQKRLWLKKKFVLATHYCITIDRVSESYYAEIIANDDQWEEWEELFALSELPNDLLSANGDREILLKNQPFLVLDTKFFSPDFKNRLIGEFENLDEVADGLLINSENFQALSLIQERYRGNVKSVYIDPPYNTSNDDFVYKDNFQHSSWMSMLYDRINSAQRLLSREGTFSMSIDIKELDKSIGLLDIIFDEENRKSNITIKRGSVTGPKTINPGVVNIAENILVYSNKSDDWAPVKAYREKEYDTRYNQFIVNIEAHFTDWTFSTVLEAFAKSHGVPKRELKKTLGVEYDKKLQMFVIENSRRVVRTADLDSSSASLSAINLKEESKNNPKIIYHLSREGYNDYFFTNGNRLLFYKDRLIAIGNTFVPGERVSDIWDDVLPNDLHNEGGVTLRKGKKPEKLVHRVFDMSSIPDDLVLDCFLGSGTSAAVAQKSKRKWIGIESGTYFRDVPLARLKNTLHGESSGISKLMEWKGGGFFKYLQLESYEDTLNNLTVVEPNGATSRLLQDDSFREDFNLGYTLDVSTKNSLLTVDDFTTPFSYQLMVTEDDKPQPTSVDLVETFNYLIGLRVKTIKNIDGFRVVTGTRPDGKAALIIWRTLAEKNDQALRAFFTDQGYAGGFDFIYVNGDNTLESLKADGDRWQVLLTERIFLDRMFITA